MLKIKNLNVETHEKKILKEISFIVRENKVLGITGESGAGKSILAKSLLRLLPPKKFTLSGEINYKGGNILDLSTKELRNIRGSDIGIIFQNPMTAFNPIIKIGSQMIETIIAHNRTSKREAKNEVERCLESLKLKDAKKVMNSYPYQLSGGMMQRVVIANILLLKPKILIADEPTTALDNDTKQVIVKEIINVKKIFNMSLIFVSHDYDVLREICDDILVMKSGEIVDCGSKEHILCKSENEYVRKLFNKSLFSENEVMHHFKDRKCM